MASIRGFILHDSACLAIQQGGYDFLICKDGTVIPTNEFTDDEYIHIVLEGDFHQNDQALGIVHEQIFVLVKLIVQLSKAFQIIPDDIAAHEEDCPGPNFPWYELSVRIDTLPH